MKYLNEYRDPDKVKSLLKEIKETVTKPWKIMEVCGGQTHSLVKNGILDSLLVTISKAKDFHIRDLISIET